MSRELTRRVLLQQFLGGAGALAFPGVALVGDTTLSKLEKLLDFPSDDIDPRTAGPFVWNPVYEAEWFTRNPLVIAYRGISRHPAPVQKFRDLKQRLDESSSPESFSATMPMGVENYLKAHTREYLAEVVRRARSPLFIEAVRGRDTPITRGTVQLQGAFVAGTYTAARIALEQGIAMNLGGGLHHSMPDYATGFCVFNDVAIAIRKLQREGAIKTAGIIDGDVHHGNGNARTLNKDSDIMIADIYEATNPYPGHHYDVTCAIALDHQDLIYDSDYMQHLQTIVYQVDQQQLDVVFYLAGADPYKEDQLGRFLLTKKGLKQRDEYIIGELRKRNIPVVVLLAGGYAPKREDVVDIHHNTAMVVKKHCTSSI
jgi:acetoin utilization deacetylase AcuC-like enzyme